jgi:hypothetical protein
VVRKADKKEGLKQVKSESELVDGPVSETKSAQVDFDGKLELVNWLEQCDWTKDFSFEKIQSTKFEPEDCEVNLALLARSQKV